MKGAVICFLALAAVAFAHPADELYTDEFDNTNLDEIIDNPRILYPMMLCILDKGKCAPATKTLRSKIEDAMQTKCEKCTEKQKEGTRKMMKHIINHEPEYWSQLVAKYDPTGKYSKMYEKELKEVQN